jgi:transposase
VDGKGSGIVSCSAPADHREKRGKTMPNHSLRSDYNAESLRAEAARLPAPQRRYAMAIARLYEGDEVDAVAKASDVQPHTVRRWMHVFNEEGITGFGNAIIGGTYELRRDFSAQTVRAYAEKAFSPATKIRLFAIAQMYEGVPTREIARLAGVSEGKLSEWRNTFNTAKMVAQGEVENRQLQANARVRGSYWTADKVAASIQKAWDDEHRRKLEVVKLSVEGKSVEAIVQMTGSTRADVVTWIRVFEAGGPKALLPADASAARPQKAKPTVSRSPAPTQPSAQDVVEKTRGRPPAKLNPDHPAEEIEARAKRYEDRAQAARLMSVAQVYRGYSAEDVATRRGVSVAAVRTWLGNFRSRGFDAFPDVRDLEIRRNSVPTPPAFKPAAASPAKAAAPTAPDGMTGQSPSGAVKRGRGRPRKDSLGHMTDKVVEFFAEEARQRAMEINVAESAQNGSSSVVKRGRGRPRKDGQPNKSTAMLMKMASGLKDTVKRLSGNTKAVGGRKETEKAPAPAARVQIPFTVLQINYFAKEALGEEHGRRLKCMAALKSVDGAVGRAAKMTGIGASQISEWRDALVKEGPVGLVPPDVLEPYRPSLTTQQVDVLKAIKLDERDRRRSAATALLMLREKGYPPFVAETVGASVKDLLSWVRDVNVIIGQHDTAPSRKAVAPASQPKSAANRTAAEAMTEFQRSVLDVVEQARKAPSGAAMGRIARRNGVPLPLVEKWLRKVSRNGVERLMAETSTAQVRMPESSSAHELRSLASTISQPTANELRALAYLYDGASIAAAAQICRMSQADLSELVLDFNLLGLEALGFTDNEPLAMAVGM